MSPTPQAIRIAFILLMVLATVTVSLRPVARRVKGAVLRIDDYFIFTSWLCLCCAFIICMEGIGRGLIGTSSLRNPTTGMPIWTKFESDVIMRGYVSDYFFVASSGMTKISILLFLNSIFFIAPTFKRVYNVSLLVISAWTISFLVANNFRCNHTPAYLWESPLTISLYCRHNKQVMLANAISNAILDLWVVTIPIPIVWRLHLTTPQRIGLAAVFALGYLSTAAACVRMAYMINMIYAHNFLASNVRRNLTTYAICHLVEAAVGIIAASLPVLRPLLTHHTLRRTLQYFTTILSPSLSAGSNKFGSTSPMPSPSPQFTSWGWGRSSSVSGPCSSSSGGPPPPSTVTPRLCASSWERSISISGPCSSRPGLMSPAPPPQDASWGRSTSVSGPSFSKA